VQPASSASARRQSALGLGVGMRVRIVVGASITAPPQVEEPREPGGGEKIVAVLAGVGNLSMSELATPSP
jgi:hypothetical protein